MLILVIAVLLVFTLLTLVVWDFHRAAERGYVSYALHRFAHEAERPTDEKSNLAYTPLHEISADLIGVVGFTVSAVDGSARLSISRNDNQRKPWWVLYEEFETDKSSDKIAREKRTKRYEAEFRANTKAAIYLETLQKAAAPPPLETNKIDPFEMPPVKMPPDDDPPVAA